MGGTLSTPIKSKSFERRANGALRICSCSMQGFRHDMEDAHTIQLSLSQLHENSAFVGVYDGHSGDKASTYLKQELCKQLGEEKIINKQTITRVLKKIDEDFLSSSNSFRNHGSTAMFAVITPEFDPKNKSSTEKSELEYKVQLAWVGDSRAFTESNGFITEDHKPNLPVERNRIEKAGGVCMQNRVDGKLAVSRAIGDFGFKDNEQLSYEEQKVIGTPDVIEFTVKYGERMVIACDGLTEQMPNEQIMEILTAELKQQDDPAHALANLFEECLSSGSQDNMSAILVEFIDGGDYGIERPKTYIPGPLFRARQDKNFVRAYLKDAAKYGVKDGIELRTTAYGQDIREIRNTTNDLDLISKIQKAISELDRSMICEGGITRTNTLRTEAVELELSNRSSLDVGSSEEEDAQLDELTTFLENNSKQVAPQKPVDITSPPGEDSLVLVSPNRVSAEQPSGKSCDDPSKDSSKSTSSRISNGSKSRFQVSTIFLPQNTQMKIDKIVNSDQKSRENIIPEVSMNEDSISSSKPENVEKIIGGGLNAKVTKANESTTEKGAGFLRTPSISRSRSEGMKIDIENDKLKERSCSLTLDQQDVSVNLKRKRDEVNELIDSELKKCHIKPEDCSFIDSGRSS